MTRKIVLIAAAVLMLLSCQKDNLSSVGTSNLIMCDVECGSVVQTKGREQTTGYVRDHRPPLNLCAALEKENRGTSEPALDKNPAYIYPAKRMESNDSGYWSGKWESQTACYWISGVWTNFWVMCPAEVPLSSPDCPMPTWQVDDLKTITDEEQKKFKVGLDITSYLNGQAIYQTPDILVAYSRAKWNPKEETGGVLKLHFHHILSALKFKKGEIQGGYQITTIEVGGVYTSGTCFLTGNPDGVTGTVSAQWDYTGKDKKTQPAIENGIKDHTSGDDLYLDYFLFMLPQSLLEGAYIKVTLESTDGKKDEKQVPLSGYAWKPGKLYEYRLSYFTDKEELLVSMHEDNYYETQDDGLWRD